MKKRRLIGLVILLVSGLAAGFVIADYLELFGALSSDGGAKIPCRFRVQEEGSGKPVAGLSIRAYVRLGPEETADLEGPFQKEPDAKGVLHGSLHIWYSERRTLLFEKYNSLKAHKDDPIEFVFSHPSYRTETKAFTPRQLAEVQTVELVPKAIE